MDDAQESGVDETSNTAGARYWRGTNGRPVKSC